MARAAVKAKQAQKAKDAQKAKAQPVARSRTRGRRGHAPGGNPNQHLFFVRMRRRAKPMYFILAVLFAATFAFLGVGSGGGDLNQLFSGLNIFSHNGTSISSAQKEISKHPKAPKGYNDLATAYQGRGDTLSAIGALQSLVRVAPKDAKAWGQLGALQATAAQSFIAQYQNAYASEQLAAPSQAILPSPTSGLGKALGTNPLETVQATQVNATVTNLASQVQTYYAGSVSSFKQVAKLQPRNANAQFQLAQAAQTAGDTTTAVAAYRAYLKLNPSSTSADQIRALIKQMTRK